jgi:hypothetical protein
VSAVLSCSRQFQILYLNCASFSGIHYLAWCDIISLVLVTRLEHSLVSSAFSDRAGTSVVCNKVYFSVLLFMVCGFYLQQINTINMDQTLSCRVRCYTFGRGTVAIILNFYSFFLLLTASWTIHVIYIYEYVAVCVSGLQLCFSCG